MSEFNKINFNIDSGKAVIEFNMPPLNVLNIEAMKEINSAIESISNNTDIKCVLFKANGKAFSAGVDIGDHMDGKEVEMIEVFHNIFRQLINVEVPIIAAVEGAALGGGCEIAAFCDFIVASKKAKFGQPEILVGVFPPIAAVTFPHIFGYSKGLEMILSGEIIKAEQAKEAGLVSVLAEPEEFNDALDGFINKICSVSPVIIRNTKRAYAAGSKERFINLLDKAEDIYLNSLMKTEDAHEGLKAFLEKRKPEWKNK